MEKDKKQVIVIAGGTGLVGKKLLDILDKNKYDIIVLSRRPQKSVQPGISYAQWDPDRKHIDQIPAPDHIINLAGEGIADKRWTTDRKKQLISSRVDSALTIQKYLNDLKIKPLTYISASAVGYYGDRDDEVLGEESGPGSGFLSECCMEWEKAATQPGVLCQRRIILRIGIVLSQHGGALPKMMLTSGVRVFNYFGKGEQFCPWIHIDDLCRMIIYSLENVQISGIYNACAESPVRNKELIAQIKKVKNTEGVLVPVPKFLIKISLGEMSSVVLDSCNASCKKIINTGFKFKYSSISQALQDLLIN